MLFYFSCLAQQIFIVSYHSALLLEHRNLLTQPLFSQLVGEKARARHLFSVNAIKYINWTLSFLSHKQTKKLKNREREEAKIESNVISKY